MNFSALSGSNTPTGNVITNQSGAPIGFQRVVEVLVVLLFFENQKAMLDDERVKTLHKAWAELLRNEMERNDVTKTIGIQKERKESSL